MLRNCDCGACCEGCGHYDDCIRNAGRERSVADEVALEDGYRLRAVPRPVAAQQDRRTA